MKCTNCGANIADGFAFCTTCGTPAPMPSAHVDDSDRTVMISPDMNNPFGQTGAPAPSQFTPQPTPVTPAPSQFTPQPTPVAPAPNQFTGQPQQPFGQNTQFTGQPQQPMMGQAPYGQPMMNQTPYGQPMMNQAPKKPRKPLSKKAKIGILVGAILAILTVVTIAFIIPILTRSKLQGEYVCKDDYFYHTIVFDEGTYVVYDEEDIVSEAGIYTLDKDDNDIEMISMEGYVYDAKFDEEENIVKFGGSKYKSTNKDETLDIKLTEDYKEDLKETVETCVLTALTREDIYDEADSKWFYSIDEDDLANPEYLLEEELAKLLAYDSDTTLQFLLESGYMNIELDIYDGEVDVYIYFW